ncbi:TPA: host nuclease inhibitor protein, partial [Escherichia coli]|nr:host nuclease inhibitor protein [Escherichia coli]
MAWAWSSGLIEFGYVLPEGALPIVAGKPAT